MNVLLEPFSYEYMLNAMWVAAMVGGLCAFLSCYLMLKGWSLIGDALSHSIVPGVAGAYMLGLPFSLGAFFSGGLAVMLSDAKRLVADWRCAVALYRPGCCGGIYAGASVFSGGLLFRWTGCGQHAVS
ncbi:metal ABC transporter permease [Escherichia coli]|uniref:metal ABC transporter permease n=1 Tax=Escherichia coli TaxID=562 RepID=UPI003F5271BA